MPVQATSRATTGEGQPRGDSPAPTLTANPFVRTDTESARDYENGYTFAQEQGASGINAAGSPEWATWSARSDAWKQGFSLAVQGLGLGRLASTLSHQPESKVSAMTTELIPFGVFAFRNDEGDLPDELKLAFSIPGLAAGALGAGVGAIGGGTIGATIGNFAGGAMGKTPVGRFGQSAIGFGLGGLAGAGLGAAAGGYVGHGLGSTLSSPEDGGPSRELGIKTLGGSGYSAGVDRQVEEALNKGLISMDEANAIRGDAGAAISGHLRTVMPTGIGAGLGGLLGAGVGALTTVPGQSRLKNIAINGGLGALTGGSIGNAMSGNSAAKDDVDERLGRIVSEDPSRADPSFTPEHDMTWGRAGAGAVLGGLAGGVLGRMSPHGKGSYAIPGAIAGAVLGGASNLRSRVTNTSPIMYSDQKVGEFEASLGDDIDDSNWATERAKLAGLGSDLLAGGAGVALAPISLHTAGLGVVGANLGRNAYVSGHPELTELEKNKAVRSGGLRRGLLGLGAGALGALAGSELGGYAADNLSDAGLVPENFNTVSGDLSAHSLGSGIGMTAGGLGAADLVGRQGAEAAVMRHRGAVARANGTR